MGIRALPLTMRKVWEATAAACSLLVQWKYQMYRVCHLVVHTLQKRCRFRTTKPLVARKIRQSNGFQKVTRRQRDHLIVESTPSLRLQEIRPAGSISLMQTMTLFYPYKDKSMS